MQKEMMLSEFLFKFKIILKKRLLLFSLIFTTITLLSVVSFSLQKDNYISYANLYFDNSLGNFVEPILASLNRGISNGEKEDLIIDLGLPEDDINAISRISCSFKDEEDKIVNIVIETSSVIDLNLFSQNLKNYINDSPLILADKEFNVNRCEKMMNQIDLNIKEIDSIIGQNQNDMGDLLTLKSNLVEKKVSYNNLIVKINEFSCEYLNSFSKPLKTNSIKNHLLFSTFLFLIIMIIFILLEIIFVNE